MRSARARLSRVSHKTLKSSAPSSSFVAKKQSAQQDQLLELKRQNHRLVLQNAELREALLGEAALAKRLAILEEFDELREQKPAWKDFLSRRLEQQKTLLDLEIKALPARIIYRDAQAWNRSFWVDIGQAANEGLGKSLVEVNSPVLAGPYLIGLVEYVGEKHSRVRLVTDPATAVAVRVTRGDSQARELGHLIDLVTARLELRKKKAGKEAEVAAVLEKQLQTTAKWLQKLGVEHYLAKGELCGTNGVLWRQCSLVLKGRGFNYDFSDEEGGARDLRSGKRIDQSDSALGVSLVEAGDLLVTSGLDGIFPADIPVAIVSRVESLKEGAAWYDLEAYLCAGDLENLKTVTVLPSLQFNHR
ncbi:MAG: rod shape-determining protein MreC [Chlamydiota bacterium]